MSPGFKDRIPEYSARIEKVLDRWLPSAEKIPQRLHSAMRYAVLGGGKRLRPLLIYATGEALGLPPTRLDGPAAAVEIIHAYSLIHDDLPAMDDDKLRRGRATCHIAYDEATAILAGDALQVLAFQILSEDAAMTVTPAARVEMLKSVAIASVLLAAQSVDDLDGAKFAALDRYAKCVGLAFQIQDDILDVEGETATLGKQAGADSARNKPTYPSILGLAESKQRAAELKDEAVKALAPLGEASAPLVWLAEYIVSREN